MENDADQAGEPARDEGERVAICSREDADEEEEEEEDGIASVAAAAAIVMMVLVFLVSMVDVSRHEGMKSSSSIFDLAGRKNCK